MKSRWSSRVLRIVKEEVPLPEVTAQRTQSRRYSRSLHLIQKGSSPQSRELIHVTDDSPPHLLLKTHGVQNRASAHVYVYPAAGGHEELSSSTEPEEHTVGAYHQKSRVALRGSIDEEDEQGLCVADSNEVSREVRVAGEEQQSSGSVFILRQQESLPSTKVKIIKEASPVQKTIRIHHPEPSPTTVEVFNESADPPQAIHIHQKEPQELPQLHLITEPAEPPKTFHVYKKEPSQPRQLHLIKDPSEPPRTFHIHQKEASGPPQLHIIRDASGPPPTFHIRQKEPSGPSEIHLIKQQPPHPPEIHIIKQPAPPPQLHVIKEPAGPPQAFHISQKESAPLPELHLLKEPAGPPQVHIIKEPGPPPHTIHVHTQESAPPPDVHIIKDPPTPPQTYHVYQEEPAPPPTVAVIEQPSPPPDTIHVHRKDPPPTPEVHIIKGERAPRSTTVHIHEQESPTEILLIDEQDPTASTIRMRKKEEWPSQSHLRVRRGSLRSGVQLVRVRESHSSSSSLSVLLSDSETTATRFVGVPRRQSVGSTEVRLAEVDGTHDRDRHVVYLRNSQERSGLQVLGGDGEGQDEAPVISVVRPGRAATARSMRVVRDRPQSPSVLRVFRFERSNSTSKARTKRR